MRHPKPLPRSLTIAIFAGQFRLDRIQLMQAARGMQWNMQSKRDHVREARDCNWAMIHRIKAARAAYAREMRKRRPS